MRQRDHTYFESIKGKYQGEPLFIIGTGPSLRKEIGEKINLLAEKNALTWGVNLLSHCITGEGQFMNFIPNFWSASEFDWLPNVDASIAGFKTEKIIAVHLDPEYRPDSSTAPKDVFPDWHWVWAPENRDMCRGHFNGFGEELWWVAQGWSVVLTSAVQIGAWMGCDPVYLIGSEMTTYGHSYSEIYEPPERLNERQGKAQKSAWVAGEEYRKRGKRLIDLSGLTGTLPIEKGDFARVIKDL